MPVCSIVKLLPLGTVDDLIHYYTRPSASCNSASGRPRNLGLIVLSSWCLVMVERLFLAVQRGCLQFVIVVFPDHTHLLFLTILQTDMK